MPEIPELEAIRGFFNRRIPGKEITSAVVRIPVVVRTPAQELRETLPLDRFGPVERHGKVLLFTLASGRVLAVNPMLTGRIQYVEPGHKLAAKTCIVLGVADDGAAGGEDGRELRYLDERVMGKVYLVDREALPSLPGWAGNGPDLLDPALTERAWLERLRRYRGGIKNILVNAQFVQGIGNAYADEILWEARINPYTPKTKLREDDLRRLRQAALDVMAWATPLVAERMVHDDTLDYEERRDFLRVHRRGGEPCPRCGSRITEITAGQRITDFCRTCQPGGPRLSREL
jgi:formamidopyrimidine-DNA glycosylase